LIDDKVKKIQAQIEAMAEEDKFSGAVLIAKDDKVVLEQAYGLAEKRFKTPNTIDTIFNVGSLNKLITKVAILQLVQKGLLELDDLVGKHIPDFKDEITSKVRIRHLISFTSGMGDYFNEKFQQSIGYLRKLDDFIKLFIEDSLLFEPGEGNQYSNAGYVVLGKIIEAVSGQDYYDYVKEHIYLPAGMNNSDHYELDIPVPNLATGYTKEMPDGSIHPTKRRSNYFIIGTRGSSAGGGHSTVQDWLKFDLALANNKILDEKHSRMVLLPLDANPDKKPSVIGLAGGAPGLSALYLKFFKLGYTIIVFSNYDPDDVEPIAEGVRDIIVGEAERGPVHKIRDDESETKQECCGN
jgi:CubicO group peptidase (beta-lactamase class C family)